MPIRAWWEHVVTTWKAFRPARRRRSSARFSAETFEPRRMLSAFFVNSLADSHDVIPGDSIAADANGFTTLRAAVEEANALVGADTITLPPGVIALSASNGPLTVTDNLTIVGNSSGLIDGTAFDEVFSVQGDTKLKLDDVAVLSSGTLPASLKPMLLTTNTRQADLIVAFAPTSPTPFAADSKMTSGLSSLVAMMTPEIVFDELASPPAAKGTALNEIAVPTPEQAIDQIINALFRNEPDFVVPVSANQKPGPIAGDDARPMSQTDFDQKPAPAQGDSESPPESMSSDDERSSADTDDDEAVGAILRGWSNEAGWGEFDFLTRGTTTITAQPRQASRLAVFAGALLSGVVTNAWSPAPRDSWRTRIARLRHRAR